MTDQSRLERVNDGRPGGPGVTRRGQGGRRRPGLKASSRFPPLKRGEGPAGGAGAAGPALLLGCEGSSLLTRGSQ